jgi:hypothetical protein
MTWQLSLQYVGVAFVVVTLSFCSRLRRAKIPITPAHSARCGFPPRRWLFARLPHFCSGPCSGCWEVMTLTELLPAEVEHSQLGTIYVVTWLTPDKATTSPSKFRRSRSWN